MTSTSAPQTDRRTQRFVLAVWLVMTLSGFFFVFRYPSNSPIIDEWEFIPALVNEEPFWPWLWKLHNEHRFPLPRIIYYSLFQITHDFRAGCFVSLIGISALALGMIRLARSIRGHAHFADAFFPLSLLHWGHFENYRMGYQICFMLIPLFAGGLLAVMLQTDRTNLFRQGMLGGAIGIGLLLCGAGGLAFGPPVAVWLLALAYWLCASNERWHVLKAFGLIVLAGCQIAYIILYFHGYTRPELHPPSAGVWPSLVVAFQALSMSFGPAGMALWPAVPGWRTLGLVAVTLIVAALAALALVGGFRWMQKSDVDRPRALGLLLLMSAVAALAFGIGWGRSGFIDKDGHCNMGLAVRYGWIVWPMLAALYFLGTSLPHVRAVNWLPIGLFCATLLAMPANVYTGFDNGEAHRSRESRWQSDIRLGLNGEQLVAKYVPDWPEFLQERIRVGVRLLREHGISYYRQVPANGGPPP